MFLTDKPSSPLEVSGIDFNSTTVSGVLIAGETYRFSATQDCWLYLESEGRDCVPGDEVFLAAGVVEYWTILSNGSIVGVLRDSADGTLTCAKMGK